MGAGQALPREIGASSMSCLTSSKGTPSGADVADSSRGRAQTRVKKRVAGLGGDRHPWCEEEPALRSVVDLRPQPGLVCAERTCVRTTNRMGSAWPTL